MIRTFFLVRDQDVTGVSGTGVVAAGMEFPDGHVIMRWIVGEHCSSVSWDSMAAMKAIHGHNGATRVYYVGDIDPAAYGHPPVKLPQPWRTPVKIKPLPFEGLNETLCRVYSEVKS